MPRWIGWLMLADLIAALLLAAVLARLAKSGRFWSTFLRSAFLLGLFTAIASFLIYFGGWMLFKRLT